MRYQSLTTWGVKMKKVGILIAAAMMIAVSAPTAAKVKHVKQTGKGTATQATSTGAPANDAAQAATTAGRAIPVAAHATNFFASPLGILTAVGASGGAAASVAALSSKGSDSSPQ